MLIASVVLLSTFGVLAAIQLAYAYLRVVRGSGVSQVPLVNGLIGALGFWLYPDPAVARCWWLAFVIDWGCLPLLVEWIVYWAWVGRRRRANGDGAAPGPPGVGPPG